MLKQLKFDFERMRYQKKYTIILIIILLLSIFFAAFLIYKGQSNLEVVKSSLKQFRPFYWLICCYLICDLITVDYHNGTMKEVIPYSSSRKIYLISKTIIAVGTCYLILFIYLCSTIIITAVSTTQLDYLQVVNFFFLASLGAFETILLFIGFFLLSMIITESEAVTIGFALGTVFIMLLLESIQQAIKYVPTMQMIQLPLSRGTDLNLGIQVVMVLVSLGVISLVTTIQVFKRKDLFL